jgi:hypothetical protein
MIDALKIIRDFLLDSDDLWELTGDRIYAGRDQPPKGYDPGDGDCITFRIRGGRHDYDDALLIPSVQFKCYGDTEVGSYGLYRALHDALYNEVNGNVLHAEEEMIGHTLEEIDSEWIFTLCAFSLMIRRE